LAATIRTTMAALGNMNARSFTAGEMNATSVKVGFAMSMAAQLTAAGGARLMARDKYPLVRAGHIQPAAYADMAVFVDEGSPVGLIEFRYAELGLLAAVADLDEPTRLARLPGLQHEAGQATWRAASALEHRSALGKGALRPILGLLHDAMNTLRAHALIMAGPLRAPPPLFAVIGLGARLFLFYVPFIAGYTEIPIHVPVPLRPRAPEPTLPNPPQVPAGGLPPPPPAMMAGPVVVGPVLVDLSGEQQFELFKQATERPMTPERGTKRPRSPTEDDTVGKAAAVPKKKKPKTTHAKPSEGIFVVCHTCGDTFKQAKSISGKKCGKCKKETKLAKEAAAAGAAVGASVLMPMTVAAVPEKPVA
jgi:hypothetical protein